MYYGHQQADVIEAMTPARRAFYQRQISQLIDEINEANKPKSITT
jgi:hypothetical protein